MNHKIEIKESTRGFYLKVDTYYIHQMYQDHIKSLKNVDEKDLDGVSIWKDNEKVKEFLNLYEDKIIESTKTPYFFNKKHNLYTIYKI